MSVTLCPRLRPLEIFPVGEPSEMLFAVRDPQGFGQSVVLPYPAAVLATLMNGRRRLSEIQAQFQLQIGQAVPLLDLERFIGQLDQACLLDSERYRALWQKELDGYLANPVRPAAHAGGAYEGEPDALRAQLANLFTCAEGPGAAIRCCCGNIGRAGPLVRSAEPTHRPPSRRASVRLGV